jgi:hypothetical protein
MPGDGLWSLFDFGPNWPEVGALEKYPPTNHDKNRAKWAPIFETAT